jgi:CRP-like cAMP-binding protein
MDTSEKFLKLKAYYQALVPGMSPESWDITENVLSVRTFKKGEFIVKEGSICKNVSFINSGLIRMYYTFNGKEKIISFCNENNYISDYQSFLTRMPALSNVQALEPTEVVDTSYDDLQMLYNRVPEANYMGRMIAEKLFLEMCEASHTVVKESLLQRYRQLIAEQPWLMQRVPQYMIASLLGITPEALSRIKSRVHSTKKTLAVGV